MTDIPSDAAGTASVAGFGEAGYGASAGSHGYLGRPGSPVVGGSGDSAFGPWPASAAYSSTNIDRYYGIQLAGCVFPMAAGFLLYGWRAVIAVAGVLTSVIVATWLWRRIDRRGPSLAYAHLAWAGALLALLLPAHLAGRHPIGGVHQVFWLLPAAGFMLVMFTRLLGGTGGGRISPVLATYLVLWALFAPAMQNGRILQRDRLLWGDLLSAPNPPTAVVPFDADPWIIQKPPGKGADAQWIAPAAVQLQLFTTAGSGTQEWSSLPLLLRDRLPPLEDLILAGQPSAIGLGSGLAIIVGGLYLLYRGLLDARITLVILTTAYAAMLVLPLPANEAGFGGYRPLISGIPGTTAAAAMTFIHYQLLASPLLFIAIYLAPAPPLRPVGRTARLVYAFLIGLLAAAAQYYGSVQWGAALALLLTSLLTPYLDKIARSRTLV